jgi:predicted ester cyclase
MTMTDTNKRAIQRLYNDMINPGRLDNLGELVSDDLINPDGTRGAAGFAVTMTRLRTALPDLHYTLEDVIAEGDRVAVRWTLRGTHTGELRGLAPSGKKIINNGFAIFRLAGGKIVHATVDTDRLGFLLAIGRIAYDPSFGPPPRTE